MMWGATLLFLSYVVTQVTSHEIKVDCREYSGMPTTADSTPSVLEDLRVERAIVGGKDQLNISWAINIDPSNKYLVGTRIRIAGEAIYNCTYHPALAKAVLPGSKIWFHYLVNASYGFTSIEAANIPLPLSESGMPYKLTTINIPLPKQPIISKTTTTTTTTTTVPTVETTSLDWSKKDVFLFSKAVAVFGGLAGLIILTSCYIIYKSCGANVATSLGFKRLPTSAMGPAPVFLVYPAENPAFQSAVVALAEFLQWQGGCNVAVDMWQQTKIAELGPMRWLAEKVKTAHRVLIVCPQTSSQTSHAPPNQNFQEPSIPAATHDLYPLILNMVASHTKNASDLAKFWVVQLGERQDKKPSNLPLELRACKTFCLMKDLNKLCRSLHTKSQNDRKISNMIFRPEIACGEKCTEKLREAVEKLGGHQPSILREVEPLKSVVAIV